MYSKILLETSKQLSCKIKIFLIHTTHLMSKKNTDTSGRFGDLFNKPVDLIASTHP